MCQSSFNKRKEKKKNTLLSLARVLLTAFLAVLSSLSCSASRAPHHHALLILSLLCYSFSSASPSAGSRNLEKDCSSDSPVESA